MQRVKNLMTIIKVRTVCLTFKRRFIFNSADDLIQFMHAMNFELSTDGNISYFDVLWYLPEETYHKQYKFVRDCVLFGWNNKDKWRTKKLRKGRYLLILPHPDYWWRNVLGVDLSNGKDFTAVGKDSFEN